MTTSHVIDTTADPFIPDGLIVAEHHKNGSLVWNPNKIELYEPNFRVQVTKDQDEKLRGALSIIMEKGIQGTEVVSELEGKGALNTNVLDYLVKHQDLIPEAWKLNEDGVIQHINFLGTIYNKPEDGVDNFCACYLYWNETHWDWDYKMLVYRWDTGEVAAILK